MKRSLFQKYDQVEDRVNEYEHLNVGDSTKRDVSLVWKDMALFLEKKIVPIN